MIEHTPGPWEAYCRDVGHEDGTPWPEDNFLQWEVSGPRVPDGRGEYYEADARLIAAAPDLLEALELCLHAVELAGWEGDFCAYKARAAIAKATGQKGGLASDPSESGPGGFFQSTEALDMGNGKP